MNKIKASVKTFSESREAHTGGVLARRGPGRAGKRQQRSSNLTSNIAQGARATKGSACVLGGEGRCGSVAADRRRRPEWPVGPCGGERYRRVKACGFRRRPWRQEDLLSPGSGQAASGDSPAESKKKGGGRLRHPHWLSPNQAKPGIKSRGSSSSMP